MQQYQKYFKPCAIGMCILYLIFVLFLPFIVIEGLGMSNSGNFGDVIDDTGWVVLPLIAGVAMAAAVWFLPGKKAAIVCAVGAFIALISFFLVKGYYDGELTKQAGGSGYAALARSLVDFKIGVGVILALIVGLIAAVLCWLSDQGPRQDRTPV